MRLKKASVKRSTFITMNIWKFVMEFQLLRCYQRKQVSYYLGGLYNSSELFMRELTNADTAVIDTH